MKSLRDEKYRSDRGLSRDEFILEGDDTKDKACVAARPLSRDWICTVLYLPLFIGILLIFHLPLLCASLLSAPLFRRILDAMNWCILKNLELVAGVEFRVRDLREAPTSGGVLCVANHQSMYDIPLLIIVLRSLSPVFVAKRELARWIPSISLSLRVMGSIIINRSEPKHALEIIESGGKEVFGRGMTLCIFPEGTRARNGVVRPFKVRGYEALRTANPSTSIVGCAIQGSWRLLRWNLFPIPWGEAVTLTLFDVPHGDSPRSELQSIENTIRECLSDKN
jgi:1-acyl-sn-glycerol-3-phosphate acyltransferase